MHLCVMKQIFDGIFSRYEIMLYTSQDISSRGIRYAYVLGIYKEKYIYIHIYIMLIYLSVS